MPSVKVSASFASTKSLSEAAALLACRAKLAQKFRSIAKIFDKEHPKTSAQSIGDPLFSFDDKTEDGISVASLQQAWRDGNPDEQLDEELERLANHQDPAVREIADRVRRLVPHAMMRFMHAGFSNQRELYRALVANEGLVRIVRGRSTHIFDEKPSEAVRKKLNLT